MPYFSHLLIKEIYEHSFDYVVRPLVVKVQNYNFIMLSSGLRSQSHRSQYLAGAGASLFLSGSGVSKTKTETSYFWQLFKYIVGYFLAIFGYFFRFLAGASC